MEREANDNNLKELSHFVRKLRKKWYYVLISLFITCVIARAVNQYTTPVYLVKASALVKGSKDASNSAAGILYGDELFKTTRTIKDETVLMKSYSLVSKTIDDLDFAISYYRFGSIKEFELYKESPIKVELDSSVINVPVRKDFELTLISGESFQIFVDEKSEYSGFFEGKTFDFGQKIKADDKLIFTVYQVPDRKVREKVKFRFNDLTRVTNRYRGAVKIEPYAKESSILTLSLKSATPQKEADFLNQLVGNYIQQGLDEKNLVAARTIEFINGQLKEISDSLKVIENQLEIFKSSNTDYDFETRNKVLLEKIDDMDKEKMRFVITNRYVDYLIDYINGGKFLQEEIIVPTTFGINSPLADDIVQEMVDVQLQMKLIKGSGSSENPIIQRKIQEVEELKINLIESISHLKQTNEIAMDEISKRYGILNDALKKLPSVEKQFISMNRVHNLMERLYIFLLEKKADVGISKSANTPDIKVIDEARVDMSPIKPIRRNNYLVAIFVGLLVPLLIIFILNFFDSRIRSKEDLVSYSNIPFLGVLGHNSSQETLIIKEAPKSSIAESLRTIRSNLQYLVDNKGKECKIFLVTSSISGEGKTFCAINLASIFALSEKRTLLVGADMRKPNMYQSFGVDESRGLSTYLAGMMTVDEVVQETSIDNLSIVPAGNVPPNPAELLLNSRMDELIEILKDRYDYVIFDTPPIGLVSDGLELMKYSDANIYMVRQDLTLRSSIMHVNDLYNAGKVRDLSLLLNDVNLNRSGYGYGFGYGYGYGYGYYDEGSLKKSFWSRLLRKK